MSNIDESLCWMLVAPLGPNSSHCISNLVACFPRVRLSLGARRWTIEVKYPNIFDELCRGRIGVILICIEVMVERAIAIISPVMVTASAASFRE